VSAETPEIKLEQVHEIMWRRTSLLMILRMTAVVGTLWLAAVFATTRGLAGSFFGVTEMAIVVALWTIPRLSLPTTALLVLLELGYFCTAANTMMLYPTGPGIPVFLGLTILVATIFHGRKGGVAAGIAGLLLISVSAWCWTTGILPFGPAVPKLSPTE
jgi:hypothetical protein